MKIICNPATYGGKSKKSWPIIEKALKEAKIDFEWEWTKGVGDATLITKDSVKDHNIICAYGGDGTINEVVTGIGQTGFKSTLGVLPAGRGNDNAFSLRQTDKLNDLIEMLQKKEHRVIDCMEVDDGIKYELGVAGAGIDAYLAEKIIGKSTRISYNIGLFKAFFSYKPQPMRIEIDDGKIIRDEKCLTVMICNGQRVGNKKLVAPNAIIDDGLFDVVIIGNTKLLESLFTSLKLSSGKHITHPKVEIIRGKKVFINTTSSKKIPTHVMGEMIGPLPHKFVCLAKKLKVLKMSNTVLEREGWTNANVFNANMKKN